MKNKALYSTAAVSVLLATLVWNSSSIAESKSSLLAMKTKSVDTSSVVLSARWSENVSITVNKSENTFRFQSDGIPSHGFSEKYLIPKNPNEQPFSGLPASAFTVAVSATDFGDSPIDTTIPTLPQYVDKTTLTSLGRIGVALSGAQFFNDYENFERTVVAQDDQVIHDHVAFLDACNGHTLVDGTQYHYHGIPVCITADLDKTDSHSVMIGVLEDGFPVYGNRGEAGAIVTNNDLDECSGHFGATPEFPDGIYHYHLTADEAPYMIDCYHGAIDNAGPRRPGRGPDFAKVAGVLGISEASLIEALGDSRPPDFEMASKKLGLGVDKLKAALTPP